MKLRKTNQEEKPLQQKSKRTKKQKKLWRQTQKSLKEDNDYESYIK